MRGLNVAALLLLLVIATPARGGDVDVLVYGGTAGGVIAAVAAAREGVSVVLLEPGKHLGGMVSGGLGWGDVNRKEIVGGYAREYFERVGKHYGKNEMVWHIEPHLAEKVFDEMAAEAGVKVRFGQRLREKGGVKVVDGRIADITSETGDTFAAKVFIDASYEGDLMAQAGVKFRVGREGISEYNEPSAGVRRMHPTGQPGSAVDDKGVLPLVHTGPPGAFGDADEKVQDYNFRLCLTRRADNRVAFTKPQSYDPRDHELLARALAKNHITALAQVLSIGVLPNDKTDINNGFTISTDLPNANWSYPNGSYAERQRIWQRHKGYTLGLLWFLASDPRVPQSLREETQQWGLAKDEFVDDENFPRQLYIREGRRMVGDYVMSEKDCRAENEKDDGIAMGSYMMDCHGVQRVLMPDNDYATEGSIGGNNRILPYEISYRALTPKRAECQNLLVPQCMSVTHVAWSSIRMEPQFMLMGHAAGVAGALAAHDKAAVQDVAIDKLRDKLKSQGQVLRWKMPGVIDSTTLAGVVVDDEQARYTGAWKATNVIGPLVGNAYRFGDARDGQKRSVRFTPELPAGKYEVRMFYAAASNRAANVKVTIHHGAGDSSVSVDEKQPMPVGGKSLGTFDFPGGKLGFVEVIGDGADGIVVVDAMQFVAVP
jgi:hypothetical protein